MDDPGRFSDPPRSVEAVQHVEETTRRLARAWNGESLSRHLGLPFCRSTGAPSPVILYTVTVTCFAGVL
jgi:hypothetical protein